MLFCLAAGCKPNRRVIGREPFILSFPLLGLRNKSEVWRVNFALTKMRTIARMLLTRPEKVRWLRSIRDCFALFLSSQLFNGRVACYLRGSVYTRFLLLPHSFSCQRPLSIAPLAQFAHPSLSPPLTNRTPSVSSRVPPFFAV